MSLPKTVPNATKGHEKYHGNGMHDISMTNFPKTLTTDSVLTRKDDAIILVPAPLQVNHSRSRDGGKDIELAKCSVQFMSMNWSRFPCGPACGGEQPPDYGKPIWTIEEAAQMLSLSKKRLEDIIYEEKVRLGRLPDFVCDAGGKIQRRIIRDEFLEWVKSGQAKRGRPVKQLR